MTDSQSLLAEYARNGSETAFRELVTRYIDLVYSTALRLVGGDTHRAEDVAQTVFVDLARKTRTLPEDVKLGGWLHRETCLVAGHTLRGERRRQSRERQAVEMNALQNHSRRTSPGSRRCSTKPSMNWVKRIERPSCSVFLSNTISARSVRPWGATKTPRA